MGGLSGGGSRARKKLHRQPATVGALKKARRRFCKATAPSLGKCDLERSSFYRGDHIAIYREKIQRDAIFPAQHGCTYFVTKAESTGEGVPRDVAVKRYTVTSLCQGGRRVTGLKSFETKREAKDAAKRRAAHKRAYY